MSKKLSLAEMMGSSGAKGVSLSNLHEVLGHLTPELPRDQVGRYRLVMALHQRFGPGFRGLPGVQGLLDEFDKDVDREHLKHKLRNIPFDPPKGKKG